MFIQVAMGLAAPIMLCVWATYCLDKLSDKYDEHDEHDDSRAPARRGRSRRSRVGRFDFWRNYTAGAAVALFAFTVVYIVLKFPDASP